MKLDNLLFFIINTLILYLQNNVNSLKAEVKSFKSSNYANLLEIDKSKTTSFIIESRPKKSSLINLKNKGTLLGYSFGMSNKEFLITAFNKNSLKIDDKKITFSGRSISVTTLTLSNKFKYIQQSQFKLVVHDTFMFNNTIYNGWNYTVITKCGSFYSIFGGNCQLASNEINREITSLPPHKIIKIEVNYHFIGNWQGETGYLRLTGDQTKFLWTYRCSKKKNKRSLITNTCGYEVCKMNYPISITLLHTDSKLNLSFGSTLSNNLPCDRSYGISDFRIYIQ